MNIVPLLPDESDESNATKNNEGVDNVAIIIQKCISVLGWI
jgi:hypothetical protein